MSLSSTAPKDRRNLFRRTSSVLEREISELQITTKEAIEKSWHEECELRRQNSFKDRKISELEEKLALTNLQANEDFPLVTSSQVDSDLDVNWNNEDGEVLVVSSLGDANANPASPQNAITKCMSGINIHEAPRHSFPLVSFFSQKNTQEEALMRQMALMEEYHKQQVAELELKLKQREAAISTLEKSMSFQISTVDSIRNAMESLEAKNRDLHKEVDDKSKVILELSQRAGIEDFPTGPVPKQNTMGVSSHSAHSRRIRNNEDGLKSSSAHTRRSTQRCFSMKS